ncbi:beta-lactamase class D [Kibdelosporangium banguiense]|uniref:Beta-lactamase class D n=1 Tax=Kibdelosporangium banguiense TaxID=1365924 RepID=A0ABS4THI1_9PSEU|nr:penicillin-binding transpeptidase domain-containing protein [Kibdelosporangium banguiense]MBP2323854.1 beta-lactamase class D [Kibdelosporangium banguiense]
MNRTGLVAALLVVLPIAGCGLFGSEPGPEDFARDFLTAYASGDTSGAAGRTDSAVNAKALLDNVRGALKPVAVKTQVTGSTTMEDKSAKVRFTADWDLGKDRHWSYEGEMEVRPDNDSFRVHWLPSVIHPKLGAQQTIGLRDKEATQAPVLDRDGAPLLAPERVVSVILDPAKAGDVAAVAGTLAAAVGKVDPAITQQSIVDGVNKTPKGQSYTVVSLRDADYQSAKAQIYELPGVRFTAATRLLAVDKNLATQLLPNIRKLVEDQVSGKPGFRVVTLNAAGGEVEEIFVKDAEAGTAAYVTLSRKIQAAAEAAIDPVPQVSAIVAIQPSTGDVLAVAQNAPADAQGAIALTGRYPPGSTFKIITSAAAFQAGSAVTADTPVGCPGTITIGPRAIPNSGNFDKGTIPLHTAFAVSCNTTFAKLAADMAPDALTNAAKQFGIGVDYVIPGITTVTGSAPPAADLTERAEDGFGQGKVLVSPFGLAVVASTVASGTVPKATLLRDKPTKIDQQPAAIPAPVLDALRAMMREVVTANPTHPLAQLPDVRGKTGTAQFGDGTHSHGWFAGYQGDLAFAVLLTDAGSSGVALDATDRFLRAVAAS